MSSGVRAPLREAGRNARVPRSTVKPPLIAPVTRPATTSLFSNACLSASQSRGRGPFTRESVARLYGIPPERIADFVEFDPANAIKFTIYRLQPSGSPGDPDIFGSQQYAAREVAPL